MSVIDRAFQDMLSTKRSATVSTGSGSGFWDLFSGAKGVSAVNYKTALKLPAFYNGVDQIGNSLGIIPFNVYQRTAEGRERAAGHPVDVLLSREPDGKSGYLTPFLFKKITQTSVLLRGNCLWKIKTAGNGNQTLKYIPWDEVFDIKKMDDGGLVYMTQKDGPLLANEVLHFKGFTYDGIIGISVIHHACLQLNVALEIQSFSYTNFEAKGVRNGVIETDKTLNPGAKESIVSGVREGFGKTTSNAPAQPNKAAIVGGLHQNFSQSTPTRVVVLDEGMKWKPITVTAQEAQIIESARFSIEDIARWLNIPLPKIKSVTQSTNNNIEQQSLDYLSDTMQPWVTNFEQELDKKLFTETEKETLYVEGNMNVILRSDMKSKGEYYSKMVNSGIFTANEIRTMENKNAMTGGEELRIPVNTQTQEQIDNNKDNGNEN